MLEDLYFGPSVTWTFHCPIWLWLGKSTFKPLEDPNLLVHGPKFRGQRSISWAPRDLEAHFTLLSLYAKIDSPSFSQGEALFSPSHLNEPDGGNMRHTHICSAILYGRDTEYERRKLSHFHVFLMLFSVYFKLTIVYVIVLLCLSFSLFRTLSFSPPDGKSSFSSSASQFFFLLPPFFHSDSSTGCVWVI